MLSHGNLFRIESSTLFRSGPCRVWEEAEVLEREILITFEESKNNFTKNCDVLEQTACRGCRISIFEDAHNFPGHCSEQHNLTSSMALLWVGRRTGDLWRPCQLKLFHDFMTLYILTRFLSVRLKKLDRYVQTFWTPNQCLDFLTRTL